ncbi:7-carboxy-7-deazaguanine synthase QueE [Nocardia sp. NPDC050793]|uniref:7-carboxy-7-deazaguanine synthase QueE n=1 Tax=Nocardia sp. NPDC050793 TaxID=3155159 RepID=UPI0033F9BFF0
MGEFTSADTLPVAEQFGPTIQGEGPHAGKVSQFIRLGTCNLACSWCDTPYTWDERRYNLARETPPVAVEDLVERATPEMLTIISGGEPLMHQRKPAWLRLLRGLDDRGCTIHLETNGTLEPNTVTRTYATAAAVSPKLGNAGTHRRGQRPDLHPGWAAYVRSSRDRLARRAFLKFVVATAEEVNASAEYAQRAGWPRDRVWVMPQGTGVEELQSRWPAIARRAADVGVNATHRIHVLAFGDTKGT